MPTEIPEVLMIEPKVFADKRGCFFEVYQEERYTQHHNKLSFVQDNLSISTKGVLRGLHFQVNQPQSKLVQVIEGSIFDVAVDLRKDSPTYKQWVGRHLSSTNFQQFFIPAGFAHGFLVLSDQVKFLYKCSANYSPKDERGIKWNDPDLNINWPLEMEPILSEKDETLPYLKDVNFGEKIC